MESGSRASALSSQFVFHHSSLPGQEGRENFPGQGTKERPSYDICFRSPLTQLSELKENRWGRLGPGPSLWSLNLYLVIGSSIFSAYRVRGQPREAQP